MKTFLRLILVISLLCGFPFPVESQYAYSSESILLSRADIEGSWLGVLKVSGIELRIVFHISKERDGTYTATMDSPDQAVAGIPVSEVKKDGNTVRISVQSANAVFEGTLSEDGTNIEGTWNQGGMSLPIVLERTDKAPEIKRRPQDPKEPYPYQAEEVSYENADAGVVLAGTLTLPETGGPHPAVLLITGSGPQDRNETLLGHRPFLVLSDYLTRRGIAVLRVDDRGIGSSTGDFSTATSEDFASDVHAGVAYLKNRSEINPRRIGLIGHSEGGLIAPMAAAQSSEIAFIVLMAGPGLNGEEILLMQQALIAKAGGASDEALAKSRDTNEQIYDALERETDETALRNAVTKIMEEAFNELSDTEKQELGYGETEIQSLVQSTIKQLTSPWFRYFMKYDPVPALENVKCPVLAIIGEKDLQVPPKENLVAIEEALKRGGNTDFTLKEMQGLNHLFQTAQTGSPTEYSTIEETISPTVLELITQWILERTGKK